MAKKSSPLDGIRNIVCFSDTHIGCRLALCHPDGADLDDGGKYMPSKMQGKLWSIWESFWNEFVPRATHGELFAVVHNGDAIDGSHHGSTTQWSQNLEDQGEHAYKILAPIVEKCEGRYFHIRGTEAHVGKSCVEEERLAKRLGAIRNEEGQYSRYDLWLKLDGGGLCHFLHHIGTTSSSAHETSAINAELSAIYTDSGRWGLQSPDVVVRSHRHRCAEVRLPTRRGYAVSAVTPAWQLKTPFVWKLAGARVTTPQIGGMIIRQGDEELHTRFFVENIARSAIETGKRRISQ